MPQRQYFARLIKMNVSSPPTEKCINLLSRWAQSESYPVSACQQCYPSPDGCIALAAREAWAMMFAHLMVAMWTATSDWGSASNTGFCPAWNAFHLKEQLYKVVSGILDAFGKWAAVTNSVSAVWCSILQITTTVIEIQVQFLESRQGHHCGNALLKAGLCERKSFDLKICGFLLCLVQSH